MDRSILLVIAVTTVTAFAGAATAGAATRGKSSAREKHCTIHTANGTGVSAKIAKFQVYEGLLKSRDAGLWSAWMATGATPGYVVKNLKYHCKIGTGLGVGCSGRAKICKQ